MYHDALQMRVRQIENRVGCVLTHETSQSPPYAETQGKSRTTLFVFDPTTFDPPSSSTQANADENAFLRRESVKSSTLHGQVAQPEIYKRTDHHNFPTVQ